MKQERRKKALKRLNTQLESGVKTEKGTLNKKIPLTKFDKARIIREINKLKERT
jgi:hypothetical protein